MDLESSVYRLISPTAGLLSRHHICHRHNNDCHQDRHEGLIDRSTAHGHLIKVYVHWLGVVDLYTPICSVVVDVDLMHIFP